MNLLEKYQNRLAVSESYYAKNHQGAKMDSQKKLMIAKVLENTNRFMTEAFESSRGTQRVDLGDYKKFCLTLNTLALPNLIASDLVMTHPMSSISGSVTFLNYVAGSNKGGVQQGELFNGVYSLGQMTPERERYTSDRVVDVITEGMKKVAWFPVVPGSAKFLDAAGNKIETEVTIGLDGDFVTVTPDPETGKMIETAAEVPADAVKVAYVYANDYIPQNDLPILGAHMDVCPLQAKVRRIAIYYSQIANFQAKTDYGINLDDSLASQAVGELAYEIDSEVVMLLANSAEEDDTLVWSKTLPVGVNKADHYTGFAEVIELAKSILYTRTQKFAPNYMLIASNILPVLTFIPGWTPAPAGVINGPYFAGTLNGMKVYVSPVMPAGKFVFGVNGSDLQTSAAVYAPYMPICPTQLLGYADGGMSQGFSTLYDLKLLSKYTKNGKEYSPLLVAGRVVA